MRTQKEERGAVEKAIILEKKNLLSIMKRLLFEICALQVFLVRSQMGMRNRLWETGGQVIVFIKWQRT